MKYKNTNSDESMREFSFYGLILALFVFLGSGIESEKDGFKSRVDVFESEVISGLDALSQEGPAFPNFSTDAPSRELSSYFLTESHQFYQLYYSIIVNLKTKDCQKSYFEYKSILSTFIASMKNVVFESESHSFL